MVDSKQQWKAWLYLAPAIVLLLIFTVWPIFNTVRMALLENYSGLKAAAGMQFELGFGNFVKVVQYKRFVQCLKNTNPASLNPVIRSIINADNRVDVTSGTVRYSIKPHKFFLFHKDTEERIRFEVK